MLNNLLTKADRTLKTGINKKINWFTAIISFSAFGCVIVFNFVKDDLLLIDQGLQRLFVKEMSFLSFGFLYGTITSFLLALSILLIFRLLKIKKKYRPVLQFLVVAYKPYIIITTMLTLRIVTAHFYETELVQNNLFIIVTLIFVTKAISGILGIWSILLITRGMRLLSGLSTLKSFVIYLAASLLLSPINFFLFF